MSSASDSRLQNYTMPFPEANETSSRIAALERQCEAIVSELKTMNDHLSRLVRRESQVRAVMERDAELDRYQTKLEDTLGQAENRITYRARRPRSGAEYEPVPTCGDRCRFSGRSLYVPVERTASARVVCRSPYKQAAAAGAVSFGAGVLATGLASSHIGRHTGVARSGHSDEVSRTCRLTGSG